MRTISVGLFMLAALPAQAMTIASNDFADGAAIPEPHIYPRCGGQNVSPDLHWSGVPKAAKSLALTMIDMSVKPSQWSHWIVVGLAPSETGLPRGLTTLPAGAKAVISNFGDAAYDGPCPPKGTGVHRYVFTIWALPAAATAIAPDAKAAEVNAMLMHDAIGHASIAGTVTP
jgi:Raf kinase inhibitor-like YbhB/YbcL family protein